MLLAEMIASGELQSLAGSADDFAARRPLSLGGIPITEGIGLGHVVLHEPRIVVKQIVAEDVKAEQARLDVAIENMRASIDRLIDHGDHDSGETRDILETFRAIANDRGWLRRLREAVATGLTAEAAVERVQNDARAKMQRQTDPYLRERLHDLDDLANRLLHELVGRSLVADHASLPDNAIIVARTMGPAALLDYDRSKLRGLVLEDGGAQSHVAIVARSLGIPAVGNVGNVINLAEQNDPIIVDGTTGHVYVRPTPDVENSYGEKARLRARRQAQYRALRDVPCVTRDGIPVDLHMNAGLVVDLQHMEETGAVSIGLFRTEIQFMVAHRFPRMREQELLYRAIFDAVPGRAVTFRTLDIGSDKILPYMDKVEEENPALGWRAIRIGLDRPALLRSQLRAMLRAGGGRDLRIMFPMVAAVEEFIQAKAIVEQEIAYLHRYSHELPAELKLGVMLEVPSLLWQLDEICTHVDFISVGSNDLLQYMFAIDRDNTRVAGRFDTLSAPVLRAMKFIAERSAAHGTPLTLCGEMGGKPLDAIALVALGFRGLSMSPAAIGPVKAAILQTDVAALRGLLDEHLDRIDGAHSLREPLRAFAEAENIPLG
jgi:phosphotransferase system enzyme I (PtsP)